MGGFHRWSFAAPAQLAASLAASTPPAFSTAIRLPLRGAGKGRIRKLRLPQGIALVANSLQ
jgi:hypothetical protein